MLASRYTKKKEHKMNLSDLEFFIKRAIFAAPVCPDGAKGSDLACPSCLAEFIAERLVFVGHVELPDPRW
jgi:hypothetical protein